MKKFLDNLKPKNTFVVFTHCDWDKPTDEFIKEKLASLKTYCELDVPAANAVLFDKTKESLEEFVSKFVKGKTHVKNDVKEEVKGYGDEVIKSAQQIDDKY